MVKLQTSGQRVATGWLTKMSYDELQESEVRCNSALFATAAKLLDDGLSPALGVVEVCSIDHSLPLPMPVTEMRAGLYTVGNIIFIADAHHVPYRGYGPRLVGSGAYQFLVQARLLMGIMQGLTPVLLPSASTTRQLFESFSQLGLRAPDHALLGNWPSEIRTIRARSTQSLPTGLCDLDTGVHTLDLQSTSIVSNGLKNFLSKKTISLRYSANYRVSSILEINIPFLKEAQVDPSLLDIWLP